MPRNGSGSYSLPEAPFVPLTTISSAAMNSDLSDIATALTGSLARDGQGGMTDVLPLNVGGFNYTNDTNTGMYRTASDAQAIKCGGTDIVSVTTSGASVTGDVAASGSVKQAGNALIPIGFGPVPCVRVTAPAGWIFVGKLYLRSAYTALWAVAQAEIALGNTFFTNGDGSTTFGVGLNMPGRTPICNDSISGSAAGTITSAVFGTNPAVIGNIGGDEDYALLQTALPNVGLSVTGTFSGTTGSLLVNSGFTAQINSSGATRQLGDIGTASVSGSISGSTSSLNGSVTQTRYKALPPGLITNYIIFAGA